MADELLRALGERQQRIPSGAEEPAEGSAESAMLRPFDEDERVALLDSAFDELDARAADPEPEVTSEPTPSPAVIDLGARRRSRTAVLGAVVAIAAALLLWLGLRGRAPGSDDQPSYLATRLDGGVATMRSGSTELPTSMELMPDASIDWIFTPEAPVRTPVAVAVVATPEHGDALVLRPNIQASDEGVVRLAGQLADLLPLPPGSWSVSVLVGAPTALRAASATNIDGDWSQVTLKVKITPAP